MAPTVDQKVKQVNDSLDAMDQKADKIIDRIYKLAETPRPETIDLKSLGEALLAQDLNLQNESLAQSEATLAKRCVNLVDKALETKRATQSARTNLAKEMETTAPPSQKLESLNQWIGGANKISKEMSQQFNDFENQFPGYVKNHPYHAMNNLAERAEQEADRIIDRAHEIAGLERPSGEIDVEGLKTNIKNNIKQQNLANEYTALLDKAQETKTIVADKKNTDLAEIKRLMAGDQEDKDAAWNKAAALQPILKDEIAKSAPLEHLDKQLEKDPKYKAVQRKLKPSRMSKIMQSVRKVFAKNKASAGKQTSAGQAGPGASKQQGHGR